jgi:hypothetical protein
MFEIKARANIIEAPFRSSTLGKAPGLISKTLENAGMACQGQTLHPAYYKHLQIVDK